MYIYIHEHVCTCEFQKQDVLPVLKRNRFVYSHQLVLLRPCHPGVSSSQGALSVLTCTVRPQQLISGQFYFYPVMSSLLVLVQIEDWKKTKKKHDDGSMFLRAKVAMACQSSSIWTVHPSWCILPLWGRMCP